MKLLLILSVVLVGIWMWRSNRESKPKRNQEKTKAPPPTDMVRCAVCSVHVPSKDAIQGEKSVYCCPDHLHLAEP